MLKSAVKPAPSAITPPAQLPPMLHCPSPVVSLHVPLAATAIEACPASTAATATKVPPIHRVQADFIECMILPSLLKVMRKNVHPHHQNRPHVAMPAGCHRADHPFAIRLL
jgi:hypothetical protein